MLKKNDIIEIEITDTGSEGEGIGRADGMAFFVVGAIPGDTVRAGVMKLKKTYGYARLIEILKPSPNRVKPRCKVAALCGGCQLQHESYEAQLKFKTDKVLNCLTRIGGLQADSDTVTLRDPVTGETARMDFAVGAAEPFGYRNKSQYPVGRDKSGKTVAGFYRNHSHDIIPCTECVLSHPVAGSIMDAVLEYMDKAGVPPYEETVVAEETPKTTGKGGKGKKRGSESVTDSGSDRMVINQSGIVRHVLIRTGHVTKQVMVCLVVCAEDVPGRELLVKLLSEACDRHDMKLESVSLCVNREITNVIMTDRIRHIWGSDHIVDRIGQISYRISPLSFFQVNPLQTRVLYSKVEELVRDSISVSAGHAENSNDSETEKRNGSGISDCDNKPVIWDMYCGTGSISLALCSVAKKVYGVEIIEAAVRDARQNARENGITNAEFFCGPAEEVVPEMYAKDPSYGADIVVVDPPRKGCDPKLLDCLVRMSPHSIIYVSCDPATLARDIKILRKGGYTLRRVMPVDMFPQTVHVETCCLLERVSNRKVDSYVKLNVKMEDYYRIKDAEKNTE
ncbi:MAG: class I SAM-dependent RNA methyltransferase [Lachnospiraceae bacterium]|nr:class I SAM-dependent RNA methyltransferase [Lachnospiraceae bacterium]